MKSCHGFFEICQNFKLNSGCLYREPCEATQTGHELSQWGRSGGVLPWDGAERPVRDMLSLIASRSFWRVQRAAGCRSHAGSPCPTGRQGGHDGTAHAGCKQPPTRLGSRPRAGDRETEAGGYACLWEGLTHPAQDRGAGAWGVGRLHTSSQTTTAGPVPLCQGPPCRLASSSNSCLQVMKHSKFKNHYYTRV